MITAPVYVLVMIVATFLLTIIGQICVLSLLRRQRGVLDRLEKLETRVDELEDDDWNDKIDHLGEDA